MMPEFRLPSVYFLIFFMVGFGMHRPCNFDNFYFSSMCMLFLRNYVLCVCYVCLVCLTLSMQRSVTYASMDRPSR